MLARVAVSAILLMQVPECAFAQAHARQSVSVPRQIIEHIQQDSTLGEAVDQFRDSLAAYLVAEPLDLNRDGIPELVIRGRNAICGANNCVAWIYRRTATGYERLLSTGSIQALNTQATLSHGFRDIMTSMHGSAWDGELTLYRFDGRQYRRAHCFTYSYRYLDSHGETHELKRQRTTPEPCQPGGTVAGDWDAYVASGSTPLAGFEGWRRTGFAHFAGRDSGFAGSIRRRTGEQTLNVTSVSTNGDSVMLTGSHGQALAAAWRGDTLVGVVMADGHPAGRRIRLVRRATPFVVERPYALWPGAVSDSQYAVTEDTAVFMTTHDGARLVSYIARPVGNGPFGVVLQRTPYTRILHPAGRFWASRGYIFVAQHVRGRDISDGKDFGDYDTDVRDGYDAVEWVAKLPGANGRVGLIGHSDEGRLAWYAAVSAPPHLAAIAPSAATGDPWRIVPYEDMIFSPINVAWACLMRARTMQDISDLDIGAALTHLPLRTLPQQLGCGDVPLWDRWIAHPTLDAYWRAHAVTTNIANVRAPVLQVSGWYDDSRGPIDYTNALRKVPGHPFIRLVMGPGAHKGVDYVAGDFGPQSRVDTRMLQLRWFDHYLLGRNNGVDTEPPIDIFVFGDKAWRKEAAWPLARAVPTKLYFSSGGSANASSGDGVLDTLPPSGAPADRFTYDPANPTPYLIDSRELETSLNEDFTALNAARRDALVFTSKPVAKPIEVTGEMSATLWAASDAKDTDWNVMVLDVFPDGHAERVQDGVARARFRKGNDREVPLTPGSVERYDIDLWFTSRVFEPGHRIRVSISSALFPKYDRNLNTGGNNERDSVFVVAHQRLVHDAAHPSHVTLPVIPR